jgi:hypothetical protein
MNSSSRQIAQMQDELAQTLAISPNLSLDDLNVVAKHKMNEINDLPNADFCGLSPTQMSNWMYSPFNELECIAISTPQDLPTSPVMRYLGLILDEAMANGGSFKATLKGNLPVKLVKKASDLLAEFALVKDATRIGLYEYAGTNEDKFNALHYTRILAELSGIIYYRSGCFHVKKAAQKQFESGGINAFFLLMLETMVNKFNWGYLDGWDGDIDFRQFWVFMLWRLQSHGSSEQLLDEMVKAFPALLHEIAGDEYVTPIQQLKSMIETRFVTRFLQYWGFVTIHPRGIFVQDEEPAKVQIQPLLTQTFQFAI